MPENFGKRGMGWHGIAAKYYEWEPNLKKAIAKILYVDQILDRNNKQDAICVVSLLESFLAGVISNFGENFIQKIIICCDNAGCYPLKFLVQCIGLLNIHYSDYFFFEGRIHTETQDGKGILDAHFSVSTQHLRSFMKNVRPNCIRHIKTPKALAAALAWNNGLANSIVQLVEVNREWMLQLFNFISPS